MIRFVVQNVYRDLGEIRYAGIKSPWVVTAGPEGKVVFPAAGLSASEAECQEMADHLNGVRK